MKKIIPLLTIALLAFIACDKNEEYGSGGHQMIKFYNDPLATETYFTVLDQVIIDVNADPSIATLSIQDVSATPVKDLPAINLTSGVGNFTSTIAAIGPYGIGDDFFLRFKGTLSDGVVSTRGIYVILEDPIALEPLVANTTLDTVISSYEISVYNATVASVNVSLRVNSGTYNALPGTWGIDAGNIMVVSPADYAIGDTLYIRVVANTATLSSTSETELIVQ